MSGQDSKDHGVLKAMWETALAALCAACCFIALGFMARLVFMMLCFGWDLVPRPRPTQPAEAPRAVPEHTSVSRGGELMVASWYGAPYHGRLTASGERYDQEAMTAAHNFLPFGALLECEVAGKTAIVRVTDRGPFIAGRDLDLSRAAARQLGMIDAGVAVLNVRRVE